MGTKGLRTKQRLICLCPNPETSGLFPKPSHPQPQYYWTFTFHWGVIPLMTLLSKQGSKVRNLICLVIIISARGVHVVASCTGKGKAVGFGSASAAEPWANNCIILSVLFLPCK